MTVTSDQLRNSARFGTPLRADTIRKLANQQDELLDAIEEYCRRFKAGDVDSLYTVVKFKALLVRHGRIS